MRPSSDSKKRPASDNAAHQNPNALPPKRQRRKSTSETSKDGQYCLALKDNMRAQCFDNITPKFS